MKHQRLFPFIAALLAITAVLSLSGWALLNWLGQSPELAQTLAAVGGYSLFGAFVGGFLTLAFMPR
ncbi:hypothetical protein [Magnetofaba australis]|nr:hypothetical protein [Magnetofaba australis]